MSKVDKLNKPMRENRKGVVFSKDNEYIYVTCKAGLTFVTNYEKKLYRLLTSRRLSYWFELDKNNFVRLRVRVRHGGKDSKRIKALEIHHLIFGYFNYGVRAKKLVSSLELMQNDLEQKGLGIDHLNCDRLNNTIANLSATPKNINSRKHKIDRKAQAPYKLVMAHKGDRFKAVLFRLGGGLDISSVITENSLESLITSVRQYMQAEPYNTFESVLENYDRNKQVSEVERTNDIELQQILYDNFDDELVGFKIALKLMELGEVEGCCIPYQSTQMYNID